MAFLDVTKAYDKAWLDGIMYAMHNNGLQGPLWNITRKMDMNLKAQIKTKDGMTRQIKIKDSIRQGGVLSVLKYASVMDDCAKEITKLNKGILIPGTNNKIGCLLWMDDVLLLADTQQELQEMLDITKKVADKYHIVFGEEKSKVMIIGKSNPKDPPTKLGDMTLKITDNYKYLGEIINNRKSTKNQMDEARRKAEGALQTILLVAGDPTLKGIQMGIIWKLVETCITPIITYASETWENNKEENKRANRILDGILKRILMVPTSTPREALHIETGLTDIVHTAKQKRCTMICRLERTKNEMINTALNIDVQKSWKNTTKSLMETLKLPENTLQRKKADQKRLIKNATTKNMKQNIEEEGKEKSKIKFLLDGIEKWEPGHQPMYMNKLNRHEVSTMFKARTRMIDVKNNFRGK